MYTNKALMLLVFHYRRAKKSFEIPNKLICSCYLCKFTPTVSRLFWSYRDFQYANSKNGILMKISYHESQQ